MYILHIHIYLERLSASIETEKILKSLQFNDIGKYFYSTGTEWSIGSRNESLFESFTRNSKV